MSTALKGCPARQRLLGLCLALASATALARPPEPVTVDAQFDPSAQAVKLVKASDDAALKTAVGVKRVAITQFAIDFITQEVEIDPRPAQEYFGFTFRPLAEGLREYL